jgi:hypothetical protein
VFTVEVHTDCGHPSSIWPFDSLTIRFTIEKGAGNGITSVSPASHVDASALSSEFLLVTPDPGHCTFMDTNNSRPVNSGLAIAIAGSAGLALSAIATGSPIAAVILASAVVLALLAVIAFYWSLLESLKRIVL